MSDVILIALWEAFSAALTYSCFCRASFTSKANTRRDIRWSFTYLGVMSVLAPFWGYEPDGFTVALLGSITVVQLTTSFHWRRGVPPQFRREP
jgi:hypothetical protein